jgi:hypothetical protein
VKFRALLTLTLTLATASVHAQEADERARSAARTLAEDGVVAYQNGDIPSAVDKLERAYQIVKLPTVGLWSARALVKSGRLVSGAERYLEVSRYKATTDPKQEQSKSEALREYDQLLPRIPAATVVLEGARSSETTVTLDGEPVLAALVGSPIPVDPKHHVVRATRGADSAEQAFDITEGQKISIKLKLGGQGTAVVAPPPGATAAVVASSPPPDGDVQADSAPSSKFWNTQRIIGVAVGGAGVVSAVVSGVFTASALSHKSDAEAEGCVDGNCSTLRGFEALSDAHSAGNVATATGIAGIALIGTGVVLFMTAPRPSSGASVSLAPAVLPGGGFLSARGTF